MVGHPREVAAHCLDGRCGIPFLEPRDDLMMISLILHPTLGGRAPALEVAPDVPVPGALN